MSAAPVRRRLAPEVQAAVRSLAVSEPALGQCRMSEELKARGVEVSPGGVRSVLLRYNLETFEKRLRALAGRLS